MHYQQLVENSCWYLRKKFIGEFSTYFSTGFWFLFPKAVKKSIRHLRVFCVLCNRHHKISPKKSFLSFSGRFCHQFSTQQHYFPQHSAKHYPQHSKTPLKSDKKPTKNIFQLTKSTETARTPQTSRLFKTAPIFELRNSVSRKKHCYQKPSPMFGKIRKVCEFRYFEFLSQKSAFYCTIWIYCDFIHIVQNGFGFIFEIYFRNKSVRFRGAGWRNPAHLFFVSTNTLWTRITMCFSAI